MPISSNTAGERSKDTNFYPGSTKFQQAYAFARRKRNPLILGPAQFASGVLIKASLLR